MSLKTNDICKDGSEGLLKEGNISKYESFIHAITQVSSENDEINDFSELRNITIASFGLDDSSIYEGQFKTRVELSRLNMNLTPKEVEIVSPMRDIESVTYLNTGPKTPKKPIIVKMPNAPKLTKINPQWLGDNLYSPTQGIRKENPSTPTQVCKQQVSIGSEFINET